MGFLKIVPLYIDFLLWPVIALGYPVCASIRAIETGSKYHMQKLVTYWTLFALISLFEIAFVKIIEWHSPSLSKSCAAMLVHETQAVISSFYKRKEEKMINSFLDVAEKYIKENGLEALEQLIITKRECKKPDSSHSGIQVQGPDERNAAATPRLLKERNSVQKDKGKVEATEHTVSTEPNLLQSRMSLLQQKLHRMQWDNVSWADKETDALHEVKETRPPEPKAENSHPKTPPPKKVQNEWTCSLCLLTTTCERTLNAHLQGNKHKSKIEALRTSHHQEKGAESLPSVKSIFNQGHLGAAKKEIGEGSQQKPSKKNEESLPFNLPNDWERQETTRNDRFVNKPFKLRCGICNVKLLSEIDMASHLNGKMHSSNIKELWECKKPGSSHSDIRVQEPDEQNPAATPKHLKDPDSARKDDGMIEATEHTASSKPNPVQHAHSNNVVWVKKKIDAPAKVEEMIPPEAKAEDRHPEIPPPRKVQHEWMCALCQVTTTSEKMLNAHLQGKKHESKIEELITSQHNDKSTGSLLSTKDIVNQGNCGAAKKGVEEGSQQKPSKKNDEKVPFHLPNNREKPALLGHGAAATQPFKLWCGFCNVNLLSEIDMASHLNGKRHSSAIQKLRECKKPDSSHSDIQVQEPDEQNLAATPKLLEEPESAHQDKGTIEAIEQTASSEPKLRECEEHGSSHSGIQVQEPDELNPAATPKQLQEIDSAHDDNGMIEATEQTASSEPKQLKEPDSAHEGTRTIEATEQTASSDQKLVQHAQSKNVALIQEKTDALAEVMEMIPPEAKADDRHPETPSLKTVQHEWTCSLCLVKTTSEKTLNEHLQGNKHKSKIEALKTSHPNAKDTESLPSTKDILNQVNPVEVKEQLGEGSQQKPSKKNEESVPFHLPNDQGMQATPGYTRADNQQFKLGCGLCNVKLLSEIDMVSHLNGKRHSSNIQNLRDCKASDSSHSDIQIQEPDDQYPTATPKQEDKGLIEATEQTASSETKLVKETIPLEAEAENRHPVTPPPKKVQHEWACALCQVTTTSEKTLCPHLERKKHKSKFETHKASWHNGKGTESLSSTKDILNQGKTGSVNERVVEGLLEKPSKENDEKVSPHLPSDWEMAGYGEINATQQFKLRCGVCNVKLLSEIDMASHLNGKRHSSNIQNQTIKT